MAQANQPVVPLFQLSDRGRTMEIYVANDLPTALGNCQVAWTIQTGGQTMLQGGKQGVAVPATDATQVERVDLTSIPPDTSVAMISLTVADSSGRIISRYQREVFLKAWRLEDALFR